MAYNSTEALMSDGLLTVPEAVAFLRLSRSTIYALMDAGELVYVRIGRTRRIPRRALVGLAATHLNGLSLN
jgi:excisionase family DNA binding protein